MTTTNANINVNSEAYNTGYEAAKQKAPRSSNPYHRGTVDHANWDAAWVDVAPNGWLLRHSDSKYLRVATFRELVDSVCAGPEGVIEVVIDGQAVACYVEE